MDALISIESQSTANRTRRACLTKAPQRHLPCVKGRAQRGQVAYWTHRRESEPPSRSPASGAQFAVIFFDVFNELGTREATQQPIAINHLKPITCVDLWKSNWPSRTQDRQRDTTASPTGVANFPGKKHDFYTNSDCAFSPSSPLFYYSSLPVAT